MIIMGFVTAITIPLVIVYHSFTQDSNEDISSAQILQIAKKIIDAAETVYYLGDETIIEEQAYQSEKDTNLQEFDYKDKKNYWDIINKK